MHSNSLHSHDTLIASSIVTIHFAAGFCERNELKSFWTSSSVGLFIPMATGHVLIYAKNSNEALNQQF